MIGVNELKSGMVIKIDNELWSVVNYQHVKPGKGPAYLKVKIKNLLKGNVQEKSFRTADKAEDVFIEKKTMQYLYNTEDEYVFMDNTNYEQIHLIKKFLEGYELYLKEGLNVDIQFLDDRPINVIFPTFVELKITSTQPGLKGDTVTNALKHAECETGLSVQVPLFINEGDTIKIDTRNGSYSERV